MKINSAEFQELRKLVRKLSEEVELEPEEVEAYLPDISDGDDSGVYIFPRFRRTTTMTPKLLKGCGYIVEEQMNVLSEASYIIAKRKWRNSHSIWEITLFIGLIIPAILAVMGLALWFLGRLIKSLTAGRIRNRDLYIPRLRR